jgi:23S rRNA-/tRNA-specific pseudouridylate synthase
MSMIQVNDIKIFCDDHILVVNKPADLPTLVDGWHPETPFLLGILKK